MASVPVLEVRKLRKFFPADRPGLFFGTRRQVHALDGVSLALTRGEVLALVGESGCGKSTLAMALAGLERPTSGQILFEGREVADMEGRELKELRRCVQLIFQDPYESLNPTMTAAQIVAEPLQVHGLAAAAERAGRVRQALEEAGLKPAERFLHRRPEELSGGQRQRLAIAAALVLEPAVLLADEPVSMLDVSVRAEVLNLLAELRDRRGLAVLLITHDLSTAAAIADRLAVMYLGRIVELGPASRVLDAPQHPYTRALLDAVPTLDLRRRRGRTPLPGEPPDPANVPGGCRFHPRCPVALARCRQTDPWLEEVAARHAAACLLAKVGTQAP